MAPRTSVQTSQALQPEQIGDVEEGYTPEPEGQTDELGLTPEEREQWDGMREADRTPPGEPEEPPGEGEPESAGEQPAPAETAPVAAPPTKKQVPEPEDDDEPDQVTRDPRTGKEQRVISYGKHQRLLKREREQAEALRQQNEETRIQQARLAERLQILNDALTTPQPKTPQELEQERQQMMAQNPLLEPTIDPSVDLGGAMQQVQRRQEYMARAAYEQQELTQEQYEYQTMQTNFTRDAQMYAQTPEGQHFFGLNGSYQHLKNSRISEMAMSELGKDTFDQNQQFTDQEIKYLIAMYNEEEKSLVGNALRAGQSPAKAIEWHAKARGWRPPQAAAAPAPPPAPSPRAGAAPRRQMPIPPAAARPAIATPRSAIAQIQAEQAGAAASRSLSDGGGVPPGEPLSMERLLKMGDEEFGIFVDNLPKGQLDALMGRDPRGYG